MEVRLDFSLFFCFCFQLFCTAQGCPHCIAQLTTGSIEVSLTTQDQYARTDFQHTTTAVQGGLPVVFLHASQTIRTDFILFQACIIVISL